MSDYIPYIPPNWRDLQRQEAKALESAEIDRAAELQEKRRPILTALRVLGYVLGVLFLIVLLITGLAILGKASRSR